MLGARLFALPSTTARRCWAIAILLTAVAAACGGSEHGYRPWLTIAARRTLWHVTYTAIGLANALLLAGAARLAWPPRAWRGADTALAARFCLFLATVLRDPRFVWVIVDFGVTLLLLAATAFARRAEPWAAWVRGAILASVAGAVVQATGLSLHEHFNHNDLFHVLQTLGVVCFYRAARGF